MLNEAHPDRSSLAHLLFLLAWLGVLSNMWLCMDSSEVRSILARAGVVLRCLAVYCRCRTWARVDE